MSPFDVIGVGASSLDFVCRLPAYPEPTGPKAKLAITSYERSPGGQTATALAACAALGLRAAYVGTMSRDENGAFVRAALERRGVDVSRAILREAPNPFAVILVADAAAGGGERIVLWKRPEGMSLMPEDVPPGLASLTRLIHVDDVSIDAAIAAARAGAAAGVPVTSDIEKVQPGTRDLIEAVTVPIFAEHVPRELTGEPDLEAALRALRRRQSGMLCVTLGAEGAALLVGDQLIRQPAFPVPAVDTTGAGDVFRAGFIYALLRGDAPPEILRFACAAAAVSCTRAGAIAGVPSLDEVDALLRGSGC